MKKVLIALLSICCLFFNVFTVSAHDNPDTAITPDAATMPCEKCGGIAVRTFCREVEDLYPNCIHGKVGVDHL